jgi:predicted PurR-regulated permease PerM
LIYANFFYEKRIFSTRSASHSLFVLALSALLHFLFFLSTNFGESQQNLSANFGESQHNLSANFGESQQNLSANFGGSQHNLSANFGGSKVPKCQSAMSIFTVISFFNYQ